MRGATKAPSFLLINDGLIIVRNIAGPKGPTGRGVQSGRLLGKVLRRHGATCFVSLIPSFQFHHHGQHLPSSRAAVPISPRTTCPACRLIFNNQTSTFTISSTAAPRPRRSWLLPRLFLRAHIISSFPPLLSPLPTPPCLNRICKLPARTRMTARKPTISTDSGKRYLPTQHQHRTCSRRPRFLRAFKDKVHSSSHPI